MNSDDQIEYCRKINQRFATNYYLATRFFPLPIRQATWVLYAFVRVPDEFVDTDHTADLHVAWEKLEQWRSDWHVALQKKESDNPVLSASLALFKKYQIPHEYADAFLDAMVQDTHKQRYANFQELDNYMYGSAQIVGLMMTHIIGEVRSEKSEVSGDSRLSSEVLKYAKALGNAFQLTNFLRDIREDYELRNRIYMPLDELGRFGLGEEDIKNHTVDERWREFMKFQIERARWYYAEADKGIPMLHSDGRRAVRMARYLYASILDRIEENHYDVHTKRASSSWWQKLGIVMKSFRNHSAS